MPEGPPTDEPPRGLERWLRSPARMLALAALLVVVGALASSIGRIEVRLASERGPSVGLVLWTELLNWTLLVATALPLGYLLVAFGRRSTRSLATAALLLVASTATAGILYVQQTYTAIQVMENSRQPFGGDRFRGDRRGGFDRRGERGGSRDATAATQEVGEAQGDVEGQSDPRRGRSRGDRDPEEVRRRREAFTRFTGMNSADLMTRLEARWAFDFPRALLATWAIVGLGAAIRLFLDGRDREREARAYELRAAGLESELTRAQLDSLRAQLHPHFLFNALHSIGGLVRQGSTTPAVETLDALGGLLRTSLETGGESLVSLREELELLGRYLAVEKIRLGERLTVEIDAPEELQTSEVPPFLLQPIVENAVRVAVAERAGGGRVRVRARADGPRLVLEVDDDGPGFTSADLDGSTWRVGLGNVRARLASLFEAAASFELATSDDLGGARVRLVLPRDDEEEPA